MREKISINDNWLFHRGDIPTTHPLHKGPLYSQSKTERVRWGPASVEHYDKPDSYDAGVEYNQIRWDKVTLPHDYIISGTPEENENNALGFFKYENAWYRKHLTFDESDKDKRITLYFEGIAIQSVVYFNGIPVARNFCGYTGFEVDITDFIRFNEDNVIAVYVNTENHEGWWYEGGGIYRKVWLKKTDKVAIDLFGIFAHSEKKTENSWELTVDTEILNSDYEPHSVKAVVSLFDKEGNEVLNAECKDDICARDKKTLSCVLNAENVTLWDIDNPYLYKVQVELFKDGTKCDTDFVKTGFRTFEATADNGLFLNGKYVKIFGVCMHQDFGLTGKAVPDNINRYKISLLKEMGANGYRTTHYPQNEAIMDELDKQGFIVMAETRWYDSTEESLKQLEFLIKSNRNRPSVFCWSVGNEERSNSTELGKKIFKAMKAHALKFDSTRPITVAIDKEPATATVNPDCDIIGVNYNLDAYDILHESYPKTPIFSSECCATGTTRGWYYDDCPEKGYLSAFDKDTNNWFRGREDTFKFLMERKYILGFFQWIAFEHRGEAVWPRLCSQSGAIDLYLQKKDAFYQNQSHWTKEPMIHLLPHWNLPEYKGKSVRVSAYTNCDSAELFSNGESLGKKQVEKFGHAEWLVPFTEGKLEVKGYIDGKVVACDIKETSGAPYALKLKLENKDIKANGEDVAIITCSVSDKDGKEVPNASPIVSFFTNSLGTVIATGSDVSDHTPVNSSVRKMRAGRITVAVKLSDIKGELQVFAECENLVPARLDIALDD